MPKIITFAVERNIAQSLTLGDIDVPIEGGKEWFNFGEITKIEQERDGAALGDVLVTVTLAEHVTLRGSGL